MHTAKGRVVTRHKHTRRVFIQRIGKNELGQNFFVSIEIPFPKRVHVPRGGHLLAPLKTPWKSRLLRSYKVIPRAEIRTTRLVGEPVGRPSLFLPPFVPPPSWDEDQRKRYKKLKFPDTADTGVVSRAKPLGPEQQQDAADTLVAMTRDSTEFIPSNRGDRATFSQKEVERGKRWLQSWPSHSVEPKSVLNWSKRIRHYGINDPTVLEIKQPSVKKRRSKRSK
jgi:hypothetical protein